MLLVAERLLSLRLSMNTPVVATDELPAGPARAAIAIHSEVGRTCFTVAVRSLRQGVSVLYELEGEDVTQRDGQAVALDASLSFGESMGFLFDDELIVDRQPATLRQAVARLREIVSAPGLDDDESEILLEEAVEQVAVEPPPAAMRTPESPMLTKFRAGAASGAQCAAQPAAQSVAPVAKVPVARAAAGPPAPSGAAPGVAVRSGASRLGRVQPIRVRAPGAAPAVPPLLRLLAAF